MLLSYKPLHLEAQQRLQEEGCVVDIIIQYNACFYVALDILNMALVNLLINELQIYLVKCPIQRLIPYQPPGYMVPAIDILNSEYI